MFTFLTISYNQQEFIIEHLESIKFQIVNFGDGIDTFYILSDDGSTDDTVILAEQWLNQNNELFKDIEIISSNQNNGIVQNYLKGTAAIKTEIFKSLSADDLYYKNNIFTSIGDHDVIFSPVIQFDDYSIKGSLSVNHLLVCKSVDMLKRINKLNNCFNAPGSVLKSRIVKDVGLRNFLGQFQWIEDAPKWHYILNYMKGTDIGICKKSYVLYRISSGISLNITHRKYNDFLIERDIVVRKLRYRTFLLPKYINPYRYYAKYLDLKLKLYHNRCNKEVIEANEILEKDIQEAVYYINAVRKNAFDFYHRIERGELYEFKVIA